MNDYGYYMIWGLYWNGCVCGDLVCCWDLGVYDVWFCCFGCLGGGVMCDCWCGSDLFVGCGIGMVCVCDFDVCWVGWGV